ncbi:MAG: helix-turn-helix domain-containing protein [bacterium]
MPKPKLILYSQELPNCTCYEPIFNTVFANEAAETVEDFLHRLQTTEAAAAVVCCCSAQEESVEELLRLEALAGPLPVLTCSRKLNPQFIQKAAQRGVDRFLLCDMPEEKIRDLIYEAIQGGGLKTFLETCCPGSLSSSPYVRRMIDEIVHAFPHRMTEPEMAKRLGISQHWLQKTCQKAFGKTFKRLMRRIWIHQALRLMQKTTLDNVEIAQQLNYSEESNMARDFRKELGYCPTEAQRQLTLQSPEDLLL